MTPQIITETVYALAVDPNNSEKWIPDEVQVLTTGKGMTQIRATLLTGGWFKRLCSDYSLPEIKFDESTLHVICNEQGEELEDLKTLKDNEFSANQICGIIKQYTQDSQVSLHVSIAGGRKTMGFYAGYALSLYGRAQDSMSHVLVSQDFEQASEFYYPTTYEYYVKKHNSNERLDAREAQVYLANIPFVRMKDAILPKHQLKKDDGFVEVVDKINESFKEVKLNISLKDRSIIVNNKFVITDLAPREFAMLHWFADVQKKGQLGIEPPRIDANATKVSTEDAEHLQRLTLEFRRYYDDVKNIAPDFVVDKKFFESVKSLLKKALIEHLGLELSAKIAIIQKNAKRGSAFYLDIDPDAIEFIDTFEQVI